MKRLFHFLVALTLCVNSFGATFFVATNGNNGAAGTIGEPWADIRYGALTMSGGDTLNIRGGTYSDDGFELDEIKSGPATNQPTVIQSYPGEWAVYFPAIGNTNTQSGPGPHGILLQSKSNIVLSSFELNALNCWADAIKLTGLGTKYITLTNLTVRNSAMGQGILTSGGEGDGEQLFGLITHCTILTNGWKTTNEFSGQTHQIYIQHSDVVVENCLIEGQMANGGGWGVHAYTTGTNYVFRNNFFTNVQAAAIGLLGSSSRDCDIYNNVAVGCGTLLEVLNSTNVRLLNNTGHGNGRGVVVKNSTNVWVENNISSGSPINAASGFYLESCSNIVVTHNLAATNHVDFTIYKTLGLTTNNNLFQKVRYVDNAGDGETFTNATTYVTKFVSSSTGNLRVLAGSDAIGAGKTQTVFTNDFADNARVEPWTIGAFQSEQIGQSNVIFNAIIFNARILTP